MQVFTCMFFDVVLEKKKLLLSGGVTKGWDMIISADRQCLFAVRGLFLLKTTMTGALVFCNSVKMPTCFGINRIITVR